MLQNPLEFVSFKGRHINYNAPVTVYWNLHKHCFSIMQHGLVVGYARDIELRDVTFKVNESGRQRVLTTKQKNVHAFVTGFLLDSGHDFSEDIAESFERVYYNPYKYDSFMIMRGNDVYLSPITTARYAILFKNSLHGRAEMTAVSQ